MRMDGQTFSRLLSTDQGADFIRARKKTHSLALYGYLLTNAIVDEIVPSQCYVFMCCHAMAECTYVDKDKVKYKLF